MRTGIAFTPTILILVVLAWFANERGLNLVISSDFTSGFCAGLATVLAVIVIKDAVMDGKLSSENS